MNIAYFSDPHVNADPDWFPIIDSRAELILVAGDIHIDHRKARTFLQKLYDAYHIPVVAVLGNHDYESASMDVILEDIAVWNSENTGVTILENDVFHYKNTAIFGATLWSNGELYGPTEAYFSKKAFTNLQDFEYLHDNSGSISVNKMVTMSQHSRDVLTDAIHQSQAEYKILMTHFSPHPGAIAPAFGKQPINAYFANDYPSLYGYVDMVLHGHTHHSYSNMLSHGTAVLCNARGHKRHKLNPEFEIRYWDTCVLEPTLMDSNLFIPN